jgi:hypothetical protein
MLDSTFSERVSRLSAVRLSERKRMFPQELSRIAADSSARGALHSSMHIHLAQTAHERELDVRAIIVWESLVRVHRTIGAPNPPGLREDFKSLLNSQIESNYSELNASFVQVATRFGGLRQQPDLSAVLPQIVAKHEIEVDLYVDSLRATRPQEDTASPTYNFYGNVGAVQTGAQSVANTVQNLGAEDRVAIASALQQVADAIAASSSMQERHRSELLQLAAEARTQVESSEPNSTKLLTILNVLAATVQTLPNAQPAYQVLKSAVLPLGILLP